MGKSNAGDRSTPTGEFRDEPEPPSESMSEKLKPIRVVEYEHASLPRYTTVDLKLFVCTSIKIILKYLCISSHEVNAKLFCSKFKLLKM